MKNPTLLALSLGVAVAASVQADQAYTWTGVLPGYSGTIVLDSDSSVGGSTADIVSINITTPGGSASLTQANIGDVYIDNLGQLFTWNPNQITSMWLAWYTDPSDTPALSGEVGENYDHSGGLNFVGIDGTFLDVAGSIEPVDKDGAWRVVPDAGSTPLLMGLALTGLGLCRRIRK